MHLRRDRIDGAVPHTPRERNSTATGTGPWTDGIHTIRNDVGGQSWIPIDLARVLRGSDNCLPQTERIARMSAYVRLTGADGDRRRLIFGETARKLLKLG